MKQNKVNPEFWKDKRVLITGHTGFKGGWLSLWLSSMGAKITGYGLVPKTMPNLFEVFGIGYLIEKSYIANIGDLNKIQIVMKESQPDIVIHMAAQPLVRYSYANPVETYATNVMGTVHLLESMRNINSVKATIIVTTDKCYDNKEWVWGYRENDQIGGSDPYSNSKACAELVTAAYRNSYFKQLNTNQVASARAGNVVGGGDWSDDRLIPDAIKAFQNKKSLKIRNPTALRPWQHVLEPLAGYLMLAQALYEKGESYSCSWNFGPNDESNRSVEEVANLLILNWGDNAKFEKDGIEYQKEAHFLKLDSSQAVSKLGWRYKWDLDNAIQKTVEWYKAYENGANMLNFSKMQVNQYMDTNN